MNQHIKPPNGGGPTPEEEFFARLAVVVGQMNDASVTFEDKLARAIRVERIIARHVRRYLWWSWTNVIITGGNLILVGALVALRLFS